MSGNLALYNTDQAVALLYAVDCSPTLTLPFHMLPVLPVPHQKASQVVVVDNRRCPLANRHAYAVFSVHVLLDAEAHLCSAGDFQGEDP